MNPSLPVVLVVHEAFLESSVLERPNKIAVSAVTTLSAGASCTAITPPCTSRISIRRPVGGRWVVGRAGLQPDRSVGVQVTHHSLQRRGNPIRLLVHCRCSLPPRSCRCLCVEILLRVVPGGLLDQAHLLVVVRLRRIWRRCTLVAWAVHVVIHGRTLSVWALRILVHLHVSVSGALRLSLRSLLLSPLSTQSFSTLLLDNTRCGGPVGTGSHRHRGYERPSELLLRDERMHLRLIGGPSFQRVEVQEPLGEVDESVAIGHFWNMSECYAESVRIVRHSPLSISAGFMFFLGIG